MKDKAKTKSRPPLFDDPPLGTWEPIIEAIDGMMPFGRYKIQLHHPGTDSWLRVGADGGWGWLAFTLSGAIRKGARLAARENRQEIRLAERQRVLAARLSSDAGGAE